MRRLGVCVSGLVPKYPCALVLSFLLGFGLVGLILLLKSFGFEGHPPVNPFGGATLDNLLDLKWWILHLTN